MLLAAIVFVVLMVLWAVLGAYVTPPGDRQRAWGTVGIPWACVAILGYAVFRGLL